MPRLPSLPARDVVKAFSGAGFRFERQAGSHLILWHPGRRQVLSVPNHNPVRRGTLRTLIRLSGLTVEQFIELLD
jgi:predicted RNA binding protein YcfA (HicA-like mRNA interferase family)